MSARAGPRLDELAPTTRFTDRAEDYARFRPDYPAAAIDCVLAGLGAPTRLRAADVGAGTGISARRLAERRVRVLAIEPNRAMRAAAPAHSRIAWIAGTAEATALRDGAVDLVLVAQAFHWFRAGDARREFHRILRPGGRLAVMWNTRDRRDPLTRGYVDAIRAVSGEHPAGRRRLDPRAVSRGGWFEPPACRRFANAQALDREGMLGRALSASYVPRKGAGFVELRRRLGGLFERHRDARGRVTLRYRTVVWIARRRERGAAGRRGLRESARG